MSIERIAYFEYTKEDDITEKWLNEHGFFYDKMLSDKDDPAFSLRFPVYKYERLTTLDGFITIWPSDKTIKINCYEHNTRNYFARFYYWEYGQDDKYMMVINSNISAKLRELGIKATRPQEEEENA